MLCGSCAWTCKWFVIHLRRVVEGSFILDAIVYSTKCFFAYADVLRL